MRNLYLPAHIWVLDYQIKTGCVCFCVSFVHPFVLFVYVHCHPHEYGKSVSPASGQDKGLFVTSIITSCD